jgi:drug/metabolite transporter (DMT)-like permease
VVLTRKSGARDSSDVQLLSTGVVFILLSAGFMRWQDPHSLLEGALMLVLGVQIYLAQLFFFEACRFAPASLVGPMEYSGVAWACLFGLVVFSDVPTLRIILGSTLVIISGVGLALTLRPASKEKHADAMIAS